MSRITASVLDARLEPREQASRGAKARLPRLGAAAGRSDRWRQRMRRRDFATLVRHLASLIENGLSLPKSLKTLAQETSLRRYRRLLEELRRDVEAGDAFSTALSRYPRVFSTLMIHQIRIGERSGRVPEALAAIADRAEQQAELRRAISKKLTYPATVAVAGVCLVVFMLLVVVPQFQVVYARAEAPLPAMTRMLLTISRWTVQYGWIAPAATPLAYLAWRRFCGGGRVRAWIDAAVLRAPVCGPWVRDLAVLQFVDALSVMMDSGYVLLDALTTSIGAVGNRSVRRLVDELRLAVTRGERLSHELQQHTDVFPPTVRQLITVGEQTGDMARATRGVRDHLRRRVQDRVDFAVSLIEPVVTLGLAIVIGAIVLAIYMPMFGMVNTVH